MFGQPKKMWLRLLKPASRCKMMQLNFNVCMCESIAYNFVSLLYLYRFIVQICQSLFNFLFFLFRGNSSHFISNCLLSILNFFAYSKSYLLFSAVLLHLTYCRGNSKASAKKSAAREALALLQEALQVQRAARPLSLLWSLDVCDVCDACA